LARFENKIEEKMLAPSKETKPALRLFDFTMIVISLVPLALV
jgi:hypothetical protein